MSVAGTARRALALHGSARRGKSGPVWCGSAGVDGPGRVRMGAAWRGMAGMAWSGVAFHGTAWHGPARHGEARQAWSGVSPRPSNSH